LRGAALMGFGMLAEKGEGEEGEAGQE